MFNINIWPNPVPLPYTILQILSDLDLDLSRALKVKYDGAIWLLYDLLLVFNNSV